MMFSDGSKYYLKRLKNVPLSEIQKIEYNYSYVRRASYSNSIVHTLAGKIEFRSIWNRVYETLEFAHHLNFNRVTFSILDDADPRSFTVGVDKVGCDKTITSEFEITYNRPDTYRVVSPAEKNVITLCLLPILVMLGYFLVTGLPIFLSAFNNNAHLMAKILLLFIVVSLFALCGMLLYILLDYFQYLYGLRCEKENFKVKQLLPREYPLLTMTEKGLVYERHGSKYNLLWENIFALKHGWGNTYIIDNTGVKYPIPTYELISKISNNILISNIIECAGLVKHDTKNAFWVKRKNNVT